MRPGGLALLIDMGASAVDHPLVAKYRTALTLGSLREDVWYLPGIRVIYEHLSDSHFGGSGWMPGGVIPFLWPGASARASRYFRRALRAYRRGDPAAAFVQLGKSAHLLADMACPAHVRRVIHRTDPYEWYVEGNARTLRELPLPELPPMAEAAAVTASLSRFTRDFAPDRTNNAFGRLMRRLGLYKPLRRTDCEAQARAIIPVAAAHTAELIRAFLREARVS